MSRHTKKLNTKRKNKLKQEIIQYQGNRCYWCGKELKEDEITLDHLLELGNGGKKYSIKNLVISCEQCNNLRSNSPIKFKRRIDNANHDQ